jgi:putative phosphoribosyl transferase
MVQNHSMEKNQFLNRRTAGLELARVLEPEVRGGAVVVGMRGGGAGPAAIVARYLEVPFYPLLVRALGIPGHDILSMGALASEGVQLLDRDIIGRFGIPETVVRRVVARERLELQRCETVQREETRQTPDDFDCVAGQTAVIVDDGIPDSAHNILAAIKFIRKYQPRNLLVAAPVISAAAHRRLEAECEQLVCLHTPEIFVSNDYWYGQRTPESEVNLPGLY